MALHDGELLQVSDLTEITDGYSGPVLLVNDHGNMTYGTAEAGEFSEIWACV